MDVSPQLLREVEFREQWRGYNPDEVDDFLERVAAALERLQDRLKETTERAARSERRLTDESGDEALKRTLVLAQRTAQSAVDEARAEAETLLTEAREKAAAEVEAAEQRAAALDAESRVHAATTVQVLADQRAALEADVAALQGWVEAQRGELSQKLRASLELLEGEGRLSLPAPPELSEPSGPPVADAPVEEAEEPGEDAAASGRSGGDQVAEAEPDARDEAGRPGPNEDQARDGATAEDDVDPFLAELRRAVDDPEPLGPRDDDERADADQDDELTPAGRFRRRRRL